MSKLVNNHILYYCNDSGAIVPELNIFYPQEEKDMSMKIEQTTIFANLKQSFYSDMGYDVIEGDLHIPYDTIFAGMTIFLSKVKNDSVPQAVVFRDEKGNFKMGGKVYYEPSSEEGMPGNWGYDISFNEQDIITPDTKVYDYTDLTVQTTLAIFIENEFRVRLSSTYIIPQMCPIALNVLLNWLDENAKDKEVELEIGDYATCVAVIEKGKKVFSVTPSAKMKQLIKDDDKLAAKAADVKMTNDEQKAAFCITNTLQPKLHLTNATQVQHKLHPTKIIKPFIHF